MRSGKMCSVEHTCHAFECEANAMSNNNLCKYHVCLAARDYKIYKIFQTKHQQMIDDTLSLDKLATLSIETLIQYCIQLRKIINMRKEYTEKYFRPTDCDIGHAEFLDFLEDRIEFCKEAIKHKYQTPTSSSQIPPKLRKKITNSNDLINYMALQRQKSIEETQTKLSYIRKQLNRINPKINSVNISRLIRFITYSIYNFSFKYDFQKCQTIKRVFCTCEPDLEFYLKYPELLHIVTNIILNNDEGLKPLVDLFVHSDNCDACCITILFMEKDPALGVISAIPCISKDFRLEGCPTIDYGSGMYHFGVWHAK